MRKLFLTIALAFSIGINAQEEKTINFNKPDEVLSKVVEKALNVAEKTGEFVIEQAPLLLQEFYNWHIVKSIFGIILGFLLIIIGYNIRKIWGRKVDKDYEADFDEIVINGYVSEQLSTVITFVFGLIGGLVTICINTYALVFILIAPKLYLIEYFIK